MSAIPDNIRITKLNKSNGQTAQVILGMTRLTENWTKSLTLIPKPKTDANQNMTDGANTNSILDILMKAERRFTIDAFISDSLRTRIVDGYPTGQYGSIDIDGNAITDATDILDTMRSIFFGGGVFKIYINGTEYEANSDKFESKWAVNDKDTITSYDVKFTVVIGEDQ